MIVRVGQVIAKVINSILKPNLEIFVLIINKMINEIWGDCEVVIYEFEEKK